MFLTVLSYYGSILFIVLKKNINCIQTLLFVKKSTFKIKRLCYIPWFIVSLSKDLKCYRFTLDCPGIALLAFSAYYLHLIAIVDESKHTNKFFHSILISKASIPNIIPYLH